MKLSSISLIAAVLAAIAGSATAAPTPHRPFGRDVDIYSRANIHQEALDASSSAASCARKIGWHELAKVHDHDAGRHSEHVRNGTRDPKRAEWSIKKSDQTVRRVEHAEAVILNLHASHYAKEQGMHKNAEHNRKIAIGNLKYVYGDTQNPRFAEISKAAAYETFANGRAASALAAGIHNDAAHDCVEASGCAAMMKLPQLAQALDGATRMNNREMQHHIYAMNGGWPHKLSTTHYAEATQKVAKEVTAMVKKNQ